MKSAKNQDYLVPPIRYCGWGQEPVDILDTVIFKMRFLTTINPDTPIDTESLAWFGLEVIDQLKHVQSRLSD